jgi:hypothetical protein
MRGIQQDGFLPLTSGAYASRSLLADAQRSVNLFPELNPQETNPGATVTHYPRPGLTKLGAGAGLQPATGRGLYTASTGQLFAVVGQNLYYIDRGWTYNLIGQVTNLPTPVSMIDNGTALVLVDGTAAGYQVVLATNAWGGAINDPTGTFIGSVRADYVDTFLTFDAPNSNEWYCSLGLQVAFNALQTGAAVSTPDQIVTHAVNLRQVWLLKQNGSEIWYLSGAVPFPFEEWPNVFVPYGCAAPYSLARADSNLFWLSRNKDGECIAVMSQGYAVQAISTRALEYRWTNFAKVSDCVTYTYQQSGHTFVVFHFPNADESWGYDLSTKQWHQRVWIDQNGLFHRERVAFHAFVSDRNGYPPTNVGMDWATGQIYALDQNAFTDNGMPIACIRSFPHILAELKEITTTSFVADIETGQELNTGEIDQTLSPWSNGWSNGFGPIIVNGSPRIALRLSRNGGATWGNYRPRQFISAGKYRSMMRWRGLGMGRDLVAELSWSAPMQTALQGAYVDPIKHAA